MIMLLHGVSNEYIRKLYNNRWHEYKMPTLKQNTIKHKTSSYNTKAEGRLSDFCTCKTVRRGG